MMTRPQPPHQRAGRCAWAVILLALALPEGAPAADGPQKPAMFYAEAASACNVIGGVYIGDTKCLMHDNSIQQVYLNDQSRREVDSRMPVPTGSPHAWALATTAITFEYNGDRSPTLTGIAVTAAVRQRELTLLSKWWDVNSREDLLKTLKWLQYQGHRQEFQTLGRQVEALTDDAFTKLRTQLQSDGEQLNRLDSVRRNYPKLGSKGILAWDLIRYIALCRWGYAVGYLSEAEAWDHIMPAALQLQQTFTSWQDLEDDFLIGREYWSNGQANPTSLQFQIIYDQLLVDTNSPWNTLPWATDLKVSKPLPPAVP